VQVQEFLASLHFHTLYEVSFAAGLQRLAVALFSLICGAHKSIPRDGCMRAVEMHSIHRNDPDAESTTTERRWVKF
jgi:hypothetical protein